MLSFFPRGVLDEILNLIESVSEEFLPTFDWQILILFEPIIINCSVSFIRLYLSLHMLAVC